MRKPQQKYDLSIPNDDYKMAAVMEDDKANFESQKIWFYVGADNRDPGFAKVGITMNDMGSRSSYSGNPSFYLFCGFQCKHGTTQAQLRIIEQNVLNYLDEVYPTKRARHIDSQRLSECYYDINFEDFFSLLHDYLHDNHYSNFQIAGFENEIGIDEGYALAWQFNSCLPLEVQKRFRNLILRY
ncbi:TPA: hypothetical protein RXU73_004352 [Yersinia enterocolitica]|nr:hypothetical protein [Yersinia enterocolitica]